MDGPVIGVEEGEPDTTELTQDCEACASQTCEECEKMAEKPPPANCPITLTIDYPMTWTVTVGAGIKAGVKAIEGSLNGSVGYTDGKVVRMTAGCASLIPSCRAGEMYVSLTARKNRKNKVVSTYSAKFVWVDNTALGIFTVCPPPHGGHNWWEPCLDEVVSIGVGNIATEKGEAKCRFVKFLPCEADR